MWQTGTFDGFYYEAKVYEEESKFGIDGGRISKLRICWGSRWNNDSCLYNYDRGLEFDNLPPHALPKIIGHILS